MEIEFVMKKVLLIGSGGREHALAWSISKSKLLEKLYVAPGSDAMSLFAECVDIGVTDIINLRDFCLDKKIDLVVIGPEKSLVEGLADVLRTNNIAVFGPNMNAAVLESSKSFMKELCSKNNIPTAKYNTITQKSQIKETIEDIGVPCVVKCDGLAAGKGVILCNTEEDAFNVACKIFDGEFGNAGEKIIIEEMLYGRELSFFIFINGTKFVPFFTAYDYKKIGDGDTGLNTGGLGSYVFSNDANSTIIMDKIMNPTINALQKENIDFSGILYAGLIMTKDGPKLLEYNVRFGDPEIQSLLCMIQDDLLEILLKVVECKLDDIDHINMRQGAAVCVVLSAKGYPGQYKTGSIIKGLERLKDVDGLYVFHAGTKITDGSVMSNGGRVLNIVAHSSTIQDARKKAYDAIELIEWEEGYFRRDIALDIFS